MKIKILNEAGLNEALFGLSFSYNRPFKTEAEKDAVYQTALKLSSKDGGHNKFLESIVVWMDITAPRYWWQQFDTYRIGTTKQSESTMHTIMRQPLTTQNFTNILPDILDFLNHYITKKDFETVKANLPESFLQRRIVCTNYKCLRNIILQRRTHKLKEWQSCIKAILSQIKNPEFLPSID